MIGLGHPGVLWWMLLVPLTAVAFAVDGQIRKRTLERLGHLPQIRRMTATVSVSRRRWRAALVTLSVALLVVALAKPEMPGTAHLAPRRGLDLVVALDFSRSMLAPDVYPTRLERAKRELNQLIDGLKGDRVGLVAFAGVTLSYPLSNDYAAAKLFWRDLGPDDIPVGGTNLSGALRESLELLDRAKDRRPRGVKPPAQVIVLLTDGADTEGGSLEAAREAVKRGVKIYALGIGTNAGEFVPLAKRAGGSVEYLEEGGQPVRMRLDSDMLRQMATLTGGDYFQVDPERMGVDRVQRAIAGLERSEEEARVVRQPEEAYALALVPALILLLIDGLLGDRRRTQAPSRPESSVPPRKERTRRQTVPGLSALSMVILTLLPALTGFDLFERPHPDVELGNKLLAAGKAAEALEAYDRALAARPEDPTIHYDRGAALYALGRMPEAHAEFQHATDGVDPSLKADALYNMGNALLKQQHAKEALEAYKRALNLRPDDRRAKWNLELALRKMREEAQNKPQPQQDQQPQKEQQSKQQEQKEQQQSAQQQQQQQQQKDQQQSAQQQKDQQQSAQQQKDEQQQKEQQQSAQQQKDEQQQKEQQQSAQQQKQQPEEGQQRQGSEQREGQRDKRPEDKRRQAREAEHRDIDRQDAEAVLDAFERVEPTVQKDLARRKAAGARKPRRDW